MGILFLNHSTEANGKHSTSNSKIAVFFCKTSISCNGFVKLGGKTIETSHLLEHFPFLFESDIE